MSFVRIKSQRGQAMVEYIIILALIAIAAIGVYSLFGKTIRNQAAGLAVEFSGNSGQAASDASRTSSAASATDANTVKDMGKYTGENGK